ncbi:MAG TPA: DUF882 domain-containing protein [Stellaceae bacterium]|nr:DUF882 domain-containing protein [Stellaceae bacterium]
MGLPRLSIAAPLAPAAARVRLVDAHTGAVFEGPYRDARGPIAHAIDELSYFLRDEHTGGMTQIDVHVIDFLTDLMAAIGEPSAQVLSAYRSLQTNAKLERTTFGVADNSQHLYGRALDVAFPVAKLDIAADAARDMQRGGVGWYPKSHFVHLDSGPARNWELGDEGLEDALVKSPKPTPISAKPKGVMLVQGKGQLTVGGGKPASVVSSRTVTAPNGQVAGLLQPLTKSQ